MSQDSKLFVTCNKEDVIAIGNSVSKVLDKYSREVLDEYWKNNTDCHNRLQFLVRKDLKDESNKYSNGVSISSYNFEIFTFTFGSGDIHIRSLHMFPTCSQDHDDITEAYKVIFSIGYWGKYDEIMLIVADAVKEFGDVYHDCNDCDDDGFVKLF